MSRKSFAEQVREELYGVAVKKKCCKRARLLGLLINSTEYEGENKIYFRIHSMELLDFVISSYFAHFDDPNSLIECKPLPHGDKILRFRSPAISKILADIDNEGRATFLNGCELCTGCFLRGVFLACGTLNDPRKSLHLEFLVNNPKRAEFLQKVLTDCGYPPHIVKRRNGTGLYYKDGTSIEDLIAMFGSGRYAMELMNIRFERQLRGEENRATNCTTQNIAKTVSAAMRQIDAIKILKKNGKLSQLPAGIQETARLREENPEASLEELREMHNPPLTKSGLNHRLKKLIDEAELS